MAVKGQQQETELEDKIFQLCDAAHSKCLQSSTAADLHFVCKCSMPFQVWLQMYSTRHPDHRSCKSVASENISCLKCLCYLIQKTYRTAWLPLVGLTCPSSPPALHPPTSVPWEKQRRRS